MIDGYQVPAGLGHHSVIPRADATDWLGLDVLRLGPGDEWSHRFEGLEVVAVVLSGICRALVGDREYPHVGGREHVFAGPPHAVYLPPATDLTVSALASIELALVAAPAGGGTEPAHITPDQVRRFSSGQANWRRDIRLVVPPDSPITSRLIVGETVNPPGNWSGIAPHKHDETNEHESALEELYLYKAHPPDGFGVQLGYRDGSGLGRIVGNDDVVHIRSGYHPTVAAPGMTLYYLWCLAGDRKDYRISLDSRFAWLPNAEAVLSEIQ